MSKREIKPYSKKKKTTVMIVGLSGTILAFSSLIAGAIMQSCGVNEYIYLPFCIAFFPICIVTVIYLVYHYPGVLLADLHQELEKINKNGYEIINDINYNIHSFCIHNKFKHLEEGYYYKRQFNIWKDYVNYFIKTINSTDLKQTIKEEYKLFDSFKFEKKNKCLIMFIEKENVDENDLKILVNISSNFIGLEIVPHMINDTSLIVLIDKTKKCLYLVPPGKNKLSFYNIGYKLIKQKLFNKK